jgi:tetratricopeptide (TPR) repeat protein
MKSLLLYELVLLITGAIFFLALIFILVFNVVKGKPIKSLFWFFIFPIIMMGFPSFQSFAFENGKIEIKKLTREVQNNPQDEQKREELEKAIAATNPKRIEKDAEASTYVAEAQLELGNIPESEKAIQNALALEKNNPKVNAINNTIQEEKRKEILYRNNIKALHEIETKVAENNAATPKEIKQIKDILTKTPVPKYTDEKSQLVIAKSLSHIGDQESSTKIVENVLTTNPDSKEAIAIQQDTSPINVAKTIKFNAAKFETVRIRKN